MPSFFWAGMEGVRKNGDAKDGDWFQCQEKEKDLAITNPSVSAKN